MAALPCGSTSAEALHPATTMTIANSANVTSVFISISLPFAGASGCTYYSQQASFEIAFSVNLQTSTKDAIAL